MTEFMQVCSATEAPVEVPWGEGPACLIIYCVNVFAECHITADYKMDQAVTVTNLRHKNLWIAEAGFDMVGTGFSLTPNENLVNCRNHKNETRICRMHHVNDSNHMSVWLDTPLTRNDIGSFQVSVNVAQTGWTEWAIVGTVRDPWPLWLVQIVMFVALGITAALMLWLVIYQTNKEKFLHWLVLRSPWGKAMADMEEERESQLMPGRFTGVFENWKRENAYAMTKEDEHRKLLQDDEAEAERRQAQDQGLVYQL